jgi:hypothetical protein
MPVSDPSVIAAAPSRTRASAQRKWKLIPERTPHWLLWALLAFFIVGVARIGALVWHTPLIALANSYDEVRYSACFDLYPDRRDSIPPTQNSPQAPYSHYRFVHAADPICYWSTELGFQGAAAAVYYVDADVNDAQSFSVRWIGAFKFLALLILWLAFSVAWLRRREPWSALANGLLLPILFADPANTVYLNTFYAEWTSLISLYALTSLILIHEGKPARGHAFGLLAIAASALAMSKIQHIVLPLGIAVAMLLIGRWRERVWLWKGKALLIGAFAGLLIQVVQLQRDSEAIRAINVFNQADVVFTALLPNARDPVATAERLGLSPQCLQYAGLRAWQMPGFPANLCPELIQVSRSRELLTLLREPDMALRIGWHGLGALKPWLAPGLGLVEGGDFAPLPTDFFTLSAPLAANGWLRMVLFGVPFAALGVLLWRHRWRAWPRLLTVTLLTVVVTLGTLTITLLGDGLADVAKQGHLVYNAALTWWIGALVAGTRMLLPHTRRRVQAP